MNATVIPYRPRSVKTQEDAATRLHLPVPHDDAGPLVVTIPEFLAAGIRRSALWAGKRPERFVIDWLSGRQA
jgi:hypothetical protein